MVRVGKRVHWELCIHRCNKRWNVTRTLKKPVNHRLAASDYRAYTTYLSCGLITLVTHSKCDKLRYFSAMYVITLLCPTTGDLVSKETLCFVGGNRVLAES